MTPEVLEEGCYWAWQTYFTIPSMARRILKPGEKLLEMAANLYFNWAYRRMVNRLPKGTLTPLARVFEQIQGEISSSLQAVGERVQEVATGLRVQLSRNYLHFKETLLMHLDGVLDESTAYHLKDRIDMVVKKTGVDLMIHFGNVTSVTPKALHILLESTRKTFEHHRIRLTLQDLDASLQALLRQTALPTYVTVGESRSESTAGGD
jgi:anti-anti-sigma factor